MTIYTVSANLDLITAPERIASRQVVGATMYPIGNTGERALGFYVPQWAAGRSGDHNSKAARRIARRRSAKW